MQNVVQEWKKRVIVVISRSLETERSHREIDKQSYLLCHVRRVSIVWLHCRAVQNQAYGEGKVK
jgi:hypothetical protein